MVILRVEVEDFGWRRVEGLLRVRIRGVVKVSMVRVRKREWWNWWCSLDPSFVEIFVLGSKNP